MIRSSNGSDGRSLGGGRSGYSSAVKLSFVNIAGRGGGVSCRIGEIMLTMDTGLVELVELCSRWIHLSIVVLGLVKCDIYQVMARAETGEEWSVYHILAVSEKTCR